MGMNVNNSGNEYRKIVETHRAFRTNVINSDAYKSDLQKLESYKRIGDAEADQTEYEVTGEANTEVDAKAEKPSAMEYIATSLAGLTSIAQAMGQWKGGTGTGGNGTIQDGVDTITNKLDGLTAAYKKNPTTENKAILQAGVVNAQTKADAFNNGVKMMEGQENALKAAAKYGQFQELETQLQGEMTENVSTINTSQKQITNIDGGMEKISDEIEKIGDKTSATVELSNEQKEALGVATNEVKVEKNKKSEQEGTVKELMAKHDDAKNAVATDQKNIDEKNTEIKNLDGDVKTKTDNYKTKQDETKAAEAALKNASKEDSNYETLKASLDSAKEAEANAKSEKEKAEKELKEAQKELEKLKEQKQKDEAKMLEYGDAIKVGEKTLADIDMAKMQAEGQRDNAQNALEGCVNQLAAYKGTQVELKGQKETLDLNKATTEEVIKKLTAENEQINVKIDATDENKAIAKEQEKNNDKYMSSVKKQREQLQKSVNKANEALGSFAPKKASESSKAGATPASKPADGNVGNTDGTRKENVTKLTPEEEQNQNKPGGVNPWSTQKQETWMNKADKAEDAIAQYRKEHPEAMLLSDDAVKDKIEAEKKQ